MNRKHIAIGAAVAVALGLIIGLVFSGGRKLGPTTPPVAATTREPDAGLQVVVASGNTPPSATPAPSIAAVAAPAASVAVEDRPAPASQLEIAGTPITHTAAVEPRPVRVASPLDREDAAATEDGAASPPLLRIPAPPRPAPSRAEPADDEQDDGPQPPPPGDQ